jgi:hypothetical protein
MKETDSLYLACSLFKYCSINDLIQVGAFLTPSVVVFHVLLFFIFYERFLTNQKKETKIYEYVFLFFSCSIQRPIFYVCVRTCRIEISIYQVFQDR